LLSIKRLSGLGIVNN